LPEFRIVRSGCFRGGVPLPAGASAPDAVRFRAFTRPPQKDAPPAPPGHVRLTRLNLVFAIGADYQPRPSTLLWTGSIALPLDGDWIQPK